MNRIGRRIYYDLTTGNIIIDTGESFGAVSSKSTEEEINDYKVLSERNRSTFGVVELQYGQFAQDFAECVGYRINPQSKEIEFSYRDPSEPTKPPVYQKALSEQIEELRADNLALSTTVDSILTDILPTILG